MNFNKQQIIQLLADTPELSSAVVIGKSAMVLRNLRPDVEDYIEVWLPTTSLERLEMRDLVDVAGNSIYKESFDLGDDLYGNGNVVGLSHSWQQGCANTVETIESIYARLEHNNEFEEINNLYNTLEALGEGFAQEFGVSKKELDNVL